MVELRSGASRRRLNLNALRAFECAARLKSFSRAADELCVTHAAVSHQIKTLEHQLDTTLFLRLPNGVELTDEARRLQPVLSDSFDAMEAAVAALNPQPTTQQLRITATPSFASAWLVPRLSRLHSRDPELEVQMLPTLENVEFSSGKVDVGIRCGVPPWPGLAAELLMPIHLLPVCSPAFIEEHGRPDAPEALLSHSLIHADTDHRPLGEEWRLWFDSVGVSFADGVAGQSFRDPGLAMGAAINGYGIAMGYRELLEDDLLSGRLIALFDRQVRHPFSYYVVYPETLAGEARVAAFLEWAMSEVERI